MNDAAGGQRRRHPRRLLRDVAGNTLVLMAVMLVPLSALAGSGIDMARIVIVRSRMQQACDAGALAGRRMMDGTTYSREASLGADRFFDANMPKSLLDAFTLVRRFDKTADNQVAGTASVKVPMTLMSMFDVAPATVTVTCEARFEVPNLDMMFVLDTTGSMGQTNPGDSVSRIAVLRSAVTSFYTTMEAAKNNSSQTRYGFVPYSSTVNVGMLLRRDWMVDEWDYQSRQPADITTSTRTDTQGAYLYSYGSWVHQSGTVEDLPATFGDPENCAAPANTSRTTTTWSAWTPDGNGGETQIETQVINGITYAASLSGGTCRITGKRYTDYRQSKTNTRRPNPNAGQQTKTEVRTWWWHYQKVTHSVAAFKGNRADGLMAGGTIFPMLNGGGGSAWATRGVKWDAGTGACIEERQTVRQSEYGSIPAEAYDLDIDRIPERGRPETQWRPWVPSLVYARRWGGYNNPTTNLSGWPADAVTPVRHDGGYVNLVNSPNDYAACPSAARKLSVMTASQLKTYLDALKVAGRTYHDIGFLWGLRLLSPKGLFAAENTVAPNGGQIDRHLIFMTDGQTETNFADYDAYGLAGLDRRRTPASRLPAGDDEQDEIVENRLTALCAAAQRRDTTVWVIAFGTQLTSLLRDCATPGPHAYQANNAAELNGVFANIAANMAKLRLSK